MQRNRTSSLVIGALFLGVIASFGTYVFIMAAIDREGQGLAFGGIVAVLGWSAVGYIIMLVARKARIKTAGMRQVAVITAITKSFKDDLYNPNYELKFSFTDHLGAQRTGLAILSGNQAASLHVGDSISVFYDAKDCVADIPSS